jgi:hypothetical protein
MQLGIACLAVCFGVGVARMDDAEKQSVEFFRKVYEKVWMPSPHRVRMWETKPNHQTTREEVCQSEIVYFYFLEIQFNGSLYSL